MRSAKVNDKYERIIQVYSWYRTARLNVLYYEEYLRESTRLVRGHDVIIALSGAGSPIAFWQHSSQPVTQQAWFYLTLFAAISAVLKPVLRWENQLKLFAELHTQYCDLYMDLKYLIEDITAEKDLSPQSNLIFERCRMKFKELGKKEPPENKKKIRRLEMKVKEEIDINTYWLPPEIERENAGKQKTAAAATTEAPCS